jgi:multicomponent Na+:H+ antiporter subunit B
MTTYSVIFSTGARYMMPLLLMLSLFLLLRGHYLPGGGFVGGLVAAAAFLVFAYAYGVELARRLLRIDPIRLIALGLLVAFGSGLAGVFAGEPFLTGLWLPFEVPPIGKVGTPLLFDVGVYMVVLGTVLAITFTLAEESEDGQADPLSRA